MINELTNVLTNSNSPESSESLKSSVIIIGGGPAGLMAAQVLLSKGYAVDLYDAMPSLGRKFLLAGVGGLNLTHSENAQLFLSRYTKRQTQIAPYLAAFDPNAVRAWAQDLGVDTFIGSSGRVFPKEMKAAPLLRAWLQRLRSAGLRIHVNHRWLGFDEHRNLIFQTATGAKTVMATAATLCALGGGSWRKLGSDGAWVDILQKEQIKIIALAPTNCGFNCAWSTHFKERYAGMPLKTVKINKQQGECVITENGIEGSLIYAHSSLLREQIEQVGSTILYLDLIPDKSLVQIETILQQSRKNASLSNYLRKNLKMSAVKIGLIYEYSSSELRADSNKLSKLIKNLPIKLISTRPLDEAISSSGGICFENMDENQMLKNLTGIFAAGEMLDWEAPTGGYLITACLASGYSAGLGISTYLQNNN